jgi:hypothetical protein
MSIICFHYNLPLPYIAAGDNLNIPIVGYLFRCVTHACPWLKSHSAFFSLTPWVA